LGPTWERYGKTPFRRAEPGNVFTLEPSIEDAGGCGCLGIEEMVVVTETGCRWLSDRQMTLPCLEGAR
jgi:Xaa-Pro aminopeptidase